MIHPTRQRSDDQCDKLHAWLFFRTTCSCMNCIWQNSLFFSCKKNNNPTRSISQRLISAGVLCRKVNASDYFCERGAHTDTHKKCLLARRHLRIPPGFPSPVGRMLHVEPTLRAPFHPRVWRWPQPHSKTAPAPS